MCLWMDGPNGQTHYSNPLCKPITLVPMTNVGDDNNWNVSKYLEKCKRSCGDEDKNFS